MKIMEIRKLAVPLHSLISERIRRPLFDMGTLPQFIARDARLERATDACRIAAAGTKASAVPALAR